MNQKKAKALRRAAKSIAAQFPGVHNMRATYQDIVRQTKQTITVPDENVLQRGLRKLGRLLGRKSKPKTKEVEILVDETRQTVMVAGWRYVQQRLKRAVRRGDLNLDGVTGIKAMTKAASVAV
jgi:hypothetical protein